MLLQGKVQEMEQRTEALLRENQELRDSCAGLQKLSSRRQAELKRQQLQMLVRGAHGVVGVWIVVSDSVLLSVGIH